MLDKIIYKGVWFIPENPDHHVSGTLTFEPNSEPNLELLGFLTPRSNEINEPPFILGFTTDGKAITLYRSFEYSRSFSIPGIETSCYTPMYILIGKHYHNEKEFKFKVIKGGFKNLDQWINISGFKVIDTDFNTHTTKIEYCLPDSINFKLNSEIRGSINFTASSTSSKHVMKAEVEQKSEIHLEFTKPEPFFFALDKLLLFQNFLTLATFESTFPISIVVVDFDSDNKDSFTRVEVIYKPGFTYIPEHKPKPKDFLFDFKLIQDDFENIIQKWFHLNQKIAPVTNLLFDSFYNTSSFNENKFLNIIHGLETFHRRFRKNIIMSPEEHSAKIKGIVELVSAETKQWLQEKLTFTNEPNLHSRLEELILEASNETTNKMILDKVKFIQDTKNSRNYYTHYDLSLEKKALKENELFRLTHKLRVLLVISILLESGFSKAIVDEIFKKKETRFFRYLFDKSINTGVAK